MDIFIRQTFIRAHFKRMNGEVKGVEEIPEKPAPVEDDITHVAYVVNLSYGELNILNYAVQVL